MTFIDWFAGAGGFRLGMEQAGHKCIGFCENDKFAVMSYTAMHLASREQMEYIKSLSFKQRQKEILKDEYRNGEWYADDVGRVYSGDIPKADCWCFGFPCQDISIAGKQKGFKGSRSSLFFRIMYLIGQLKEENKPDVLFIENVKNLLSINRGFDFAGLLVCLDENGYDAEWEVLNSKEFGVPHNRERVFIIGHLRGRNRRKIFPVGGTKEQNCIIQVGMKKSRRKNPNSCRLYSILGISPALRTSSGGMHMPLWQIGERYRKATPRECFRLQGWPDEYFEKAALVNSESQLYKQAGNGVTAPVVKAIGEKLI